MSSEYIYDRKAINLLGVKNAYTALFVQSHSSNDGEYTPRWKLFGFSKKTDAMDHVVRCAHYCEDGLTRGVAGAPITGQYEIGQWREALRNASMITEDSSSKFVDLVFTEKPSLTSDGPQVKDALLSLANSCGVMLQHFLVDCDKHPVHTQVRMNLSLAEHADLVWDAVSTIKVPSIFAHEGMVGLPPYAFFRAIANALNAGEDFPLDPWPYVTHATTSAFELNELFFKFEFPVEGQSVWKDTRVVVTDWACRVLSMDPYGWFAARLAAMEAKVPGCAETAFRLFKQQMKALQVTPVEQIGTVEVRPLVEADAAAAAQALEKLHPWQREAIKALSSAHGKQAGQEAVYTCTPKEHLEALCLSSYAPCYIAVDALVPA